MYALCHADHADMLGTAHKASTIPNRGAVDVARPVDTISEQWQGTVGLLGYCKEHRIVCHNGKCYCNVESAHFRRVHNTRQSTTGDNSDCVYSFRAQTQFYLECVLFSPKAGQNSYPCLHTCNQ